MIACLRGEHDYRGIDRKSKKHCSRGRKTIKQSPQGNEWHPNEMRREAGERWQRPLPASQVPSPVAQELGHRLVAGGVVLEEASLHIWPHTRSILGALSAPACPVVRSAQRERLTPRQAPHPAVCSPKLQGAAQDPGTISLGPAPGFFSGKSPQFSHLEHWDNQSPYVITHIRKVPL